MPPSGSSSALWSSNNMQHNNNVSREGVGHISNGGEGGGGGGVTMNVNRGMEDDVMVSLGNVLSTVNITGGGDVDGGSGHGGGQVQQGGYGAPGTAVGSNQPVPWGSAAPAPAG